MFNPEEPTTKEMLNYIKTHWPEMVENPLELETEEGLIELRRKTNLILEESGKRMLEKVEVVKKALKEDQILVENLSKSLIVFNGGLKNLQSSLEVLWLELQMIRPQKNGSSNIFKSPTSSDFYFAGRNIIMKEKANCLPT